MVFIKIKKRSYPDYANILLMDIMRV